MSETAPQVIIIAGPNGAGKTTLENFSKLYRPLANTWAVYDNSGASSPAMIAQGGASQGPNIINADLWKRFKETSI